MEQSFKGISQRYKKNVDSVYSLMEFDEIVQTFCISALQRANTFLEKHDLNKHPSCSIQKELQQMQKIRSHGSLKPHYQTMLNQCVVLLSSYFASAVESLFTTAIPIKLDRGGTEKLNDAELRLKIGDLQLLNFNLSPAIGELIASQKDISFQDMQSIARAFTDYLEFDPKKTKHVNNIILALACRHAIVHSGGVTSTKTINQISNATPREIKNDLSPNQKILFTIDEVKIIGESMTSYLDNLIQGVSKKL